MLSSSDLLGVDLSSSSAGAISVTSGLIGIYAARKHFGKSSFRELRAWQIMAGAGLGTLLLTSFYLLAALRRQQESIVASLLGWIVWGAGSALWIGGVAALVAHFGRPSADSAPKPPAEP